MSGDFTAHAESICKAENKHLRELPNLGAHLVYLVV